MAVSETTLEIIFLLSASLEIVTFIIYSLYLLKVIKIVQFKFFNKTAKLSMLIFFTSMAIRFINGLLYFIFRYAIKATDVDFNKINAYFNFINIFATILNWLVLYYFVFEIQDVRERLTWSNSSVQELKRRQQNRRKLRFVAMCFVVIFTGTILVM